MDRYIIDLKTGWKYELVGDYYLPVGTRHEDADTVEDRSVAPVSKAAQEKEDAAAQERPAIGRFGRAHATFLKRTQRHVYSQLVAESKLGTYLAQIDEQANNMLDLLIRQMAEREGVTEQLKATDQMEWVRRMELYQAYKLWCEDNAYIPLSQRSFSQQLTENQEAYHIRASNNIYLNGGRRVRGYVGVEPTEKVQQILERMNRR